MEIKKDWDSEVCEVMKMAYELGLTSASGGNISSKDEKGNIRITPSGGDKAAYVPKDILKITPKGTVIGEGKISMEAEIHKGIYRLKPQTRGIVHAHSPNLVANSFFRKEPDILRLLPLLSEEIRGIGVARYAPAGSIELKDAVMEALSGSYEKNAVILENHGAFAASPLGLNHALELFHMLEHRMSIESRAVALTGTEDKLRFPDRDRVEDVKNKLGKYGSQKQALEHSREAEIRSFADRGIKRKLFTVGRAEISTKNPVGDMNISGSLRNKQLYEIIYRACPAAKAIVMAVPVNGMVFAITEEEFDINTIPESRLVLKNPVKKFEFGTDVLEPEVLAAYFKEGGTVAILKNQCCISVGSSLFEAYDRMEVFEACNEALLIARKYGREIHSICG